MTDRWLESLMKVVPAPIPARQETKSDPFLCAIFDRPGDEPIGSIGTLEMSKVFDDGNTAIIPKNVFDYLGSQPAAPLAKRATTAGAPMQLFMRLSKVDEARREITGIATSETPDRDGEALDYLASKPYFEEWSNSVKKDSGGASAGNLREMHGAVAAGKLSQIVFNDAAKQVEVVAKVVDDACWKKVLERVYVGFSIGGKYISTRKDGNLTRFVASPSEISLVDRPSCPDAVFELVKADGSTEICKFTGGHMSKSDEFHKASYAHHDERATSHAMMLGHHEEGSPEHSFHKSGHASHTAMRDFHKCAMEKAASDELNKVTIDNATPAVGEDQIRAVFLKMFGNALIPTGVSAIAPPRPVLRPGQPQLPAVPNVDPNFAKIFGLAEEDLHSDEPSLRK